MSSQQLSMPLHSTCCEAGQAITRQEGNGQIFWRLAGADRPVRFCPWCGQGLAVPDRPPAELGGKTPLGPPPLSDARVPRAGELYRHYRGGHAYEIWGVGRLESTLEPLVGYLDMDTPELWFRPLHEFLGVVLNPEHPEGQQVRFERVPGDALAIDWETQEPWRIQLLAQRARSCALTMLAENQSLARRLGETEKLYHALCRVA